MSLYGGTVTSQGQRLIAELLAGDTIEFTKVVVGSGVVSDESVLKDTTDLVSYIADAVMTVPLVEQDSIRFSVEYRNDLHEDIQSVIWINEIGVYARSTKNTEPVLFYYATLGDTPQPVSPYKDNRVDIKRYPVTIAISLGDGITVDYNAEAFVRSEDAYEMVEQIVGKFTHEFFHIGSTKPKVTPAFWFDTSLTEERIGSDMLLEYGDGSGVSVVVKDNESSVENADVTEQGENGVNVNVN